MIGLYKVTIPGQYKIESRLVDIYPMKLYDWTNNERNLGYDMWLHVYLGGTESRCKPFQGCELEKTCCGCDEKPIFPSSPFKIEIEDGFQKILFFIFFIFTGDC